MKSLGATEGMIEAAEVQLGCRFPADLKAVWLVSNGLELPNGWKLYSVFNPQEPRKTYENVVEENTKYRWSYMDISLLSIGANDTGNHLVLKREGGTVGEEIYLWNHETNKIRRWGKGFEYLLSKAQARIAKIERAIQSSMKRRK